MNVSILIPLAFLCHAQTPVTTAYNGNFRQGLQNSERILKPANVSHLGVIGTFTLPDGSPSYTQPLIATGVMVGGVPTTLLISGTMGGVSGTNGDDLYAFDETKPGSAPVWTANFGTPWSGGNNPTIPYSYGIMSTPVIDLPNGWVFCVSFSGAGATPLIEVNKVRLSDGAILHQTVVDNTISVPGAGCVTGETFPPCGSATETTAGGQLLFNPQWQSQRLALLLVGGRIYVGFGAGAENGIWHGWLMGVNESTGVIDYAAATSPNGNGAGMWEAGSGCASDGTYLYCLTGNGTYDLSSGGRDGGLSALKFNLNLTLADFATPGNAVADNGVDADPSSGAFILIDAGHAVYAGKDACAWLLTLSSMGHFNAMATTPPAGCSAGAGNAQQVFPIVNLTPSGGSGVYGGMYFQGTYYGPIYNQPLYAFAYSAGSFNPTAIAHTAASYKQMLLSGSSNGGSNTVLWALTTNTDTLPQRVILRAYDPLTLAELWNSGDVIGDYSHWAAPTIDGAGHVYVATLDGRIVEFGLQPSAVLQNAVVSGAVIVRE